MTAGMVAAAAMIAAAVAFAVVVVVVAADIGIVIQFAGDQGLGCRVGAAADTAIELDARLGQSHLGAAADAAADQNVRVEGIQNPCQGAVTAAHGVHNFRRYDLAVLNIINLKLLGMAEVLEDVAVFVSNCDSHMIALLSFLEQNWNQESTLLWGYTWF